MRGSELTREGVVATHWIVEKLAGCLCQRRATARGQTGKQPLGGGPAGAGGQVGRETWDFFTGARLRSHRVYVWSSPGNSLEEQVSQGCRVGTEKESGVLLGLGAGRASRNLV